VNSARRASTLRVLNTWAQLAERHNKPLDEDDIIDLRSYVIIKDRGAVKSAPGDYHIGHFTQLDSDQDCPDADQDQEDSDQDDDDELNALPPSENITDDDPPISKKELLRGVPPLSATTDAEDLREFLAAEKKRRELAGDEEDEEDMSPEQLSALRKALEEQSQEREVVIANLVRDVTSAEHPLERESDTTPTRPSAHVPPSDDESEDELGLWAHDESTAVYPVARGESEQDVHEAGREVIELTESDSDEEFEALLTRPPRLTRVSPLPIPNPKEAQQPLQSPPDSERGRSKHRARPHSRMKSAEVMSKSGDQPHSTPVPRKPEVILTHKRKSSPPKETDISDGGGSERQVAGHSPVRKGKGKETPFSVQDRHHEKTPKALGVVSRVRKRKRITSSSTSGIPLAQSPGGHLSAASPRVSKLCIVKLSYSRAKKYVAKPRKIDLPFSEPHHAPATGWPQTNVDQGHINAWWVKFRRDVSSHLPCFRLSPIRAQYCRLFALTIFVLFSIQNSAAYFIWPRPNLQIP